MKNKKAAPVVAVIVLVILVVLITLGTKLIQKYIPSKELQDMNEYYHLSADDDMAMVVDDVVLDTTCKYMDGEVYIDYESVHDMFNERFYWDANENVLLYTLPDNLITVPAGSNTYTIGKDNQTAEYTIVRNDSNTMYMALDFVEQYTNLTHTIYENPNRVVITSVWKTVDTATAKKDTQLRLKGGIKSPILKELTKGDTLTVLEPGDNWTKVATEDGMIGYLKSKFVSKLTQTERTHAFEEPVFTHMTEDKTIQMAWHQVTTAEANSNVANVLQNTKGINVLSPTWFRLTDSNGNIASIASSDYVNYCHQNGVEVWALINNIDGMDSATAIDTTTSVLTHTSARQNLVNQLISAAIQYDLDGINLDFESISGEVGDGYIQLIRELSLKCANNGVVLSVDNYVPSDYTAFYNRAEQANFADYVVIMGYDEHTGKDVGSVSSIGFAKDGVANTLKEVPAEQIILGCPFYTKMWAITPKEGVTADPNAESYDEEQYDISFENLGMDSVAKRLQLNGVTASWLDDAGQNFAQYQQDNTTYKVWVEDAASMDERMNIMKSNDLAGVSFWKLGFENSSIWDTIIKYTN